MAFTLGRGSLLSPVNDGLVRDTVGIVEDLENLGESLDHSSFGVTVDLGGVKVKRMFTTIAGRLCVGLPVQC